MIVTNLRPCWVWQNNTMVANVYVQLLLIRKTDKQNQLLDKSTGHHILSVILDSEGLSHSVLSVLWKLVQLLGKMVERQWANLRVSRLGDTREPICQVETPAWSHIVWVRICNNTGFPMMRRTLRSEMPGPVLQICKSLYLRKNELVLANFILFPSKEKT